MNIQLVAATLLLTLSMLTSCTAGEECPPRNYNKTMWTPKKMEYKKVEILDLIEKEPIFIFSVKVCKKARLRLLTPAGTGYAINIDYKDYDHHVTYLNIRTGSEWVRSKKSWTARKLSCGGFRAFWVSWNETSGYFAMGSGHYPGQDTYIYQTFTGDNIMPVRDVKIASGSDDNGEWKFFNQCPLNINECDSNPCQNGGACNDGDNTYNCTCPDGYTGLNCEAAVDVNECDSNPCQNGGTCTNTDTGFSCSCTFCYSGETCAEARSDPSGLVNITVDGNPHPAYIDKVDGGNWIVFVKRCFGKVDFARFWDDYVNGFGDPATDYWLGLDPLHSLTNEEPYELRVDIEDFNGDTAWGKWDTFQVGGADDNYTLTATGYDTNSTCGDSISAHDGMQFSTRDADHDPIPDYYCCNSYSGRQAGWWYFSCYRTLPTGLYHAEKDAGPHDATGGIIWSTFKADGRSYKAMSLKIRPKA